MALHAVICAANAPEPLTAHRVTWPPAREQNSLVRYLSTLCYDGPDQVSEKAF